MASETIKILFVATKKLIERVDDFRFDNRINSRSGAIRRLLEHALKDFLEKDKKIKNYLDKWEQQILEISSTANKVLLWPDFNDMKPKEKKRYVSEQKINLEYAWDKNNLTYQFTNKTEHIILEIDSYGKEHRFYCFDDTQVFVYGYDTMNKKLLRPYSLQERSPVL